ncbi:unnamed protein product [Protopolystoma xenopodis]|uniref:Uncharacterized protein n=1 Tax=Protopolystoma xenopodis TaxID=117903 RepID=A0A3S5ADD3_9PLAT|nr:unnamed protein product [Protopolystoma xenopodis]
MALFAGVGYEGDRGKSGKVPSHLEVRKQQQQRIQYGTPPLKSHYNYKKGLWLHEFPLTCPLGEVSGPLPRHPSNASIWQGAIEIAEPFPV